tara:strand:- start:376 stop:1482 length:1107 start_codon:yes stop_codon:yes gene_type:complete
MFVVLVAPPGRNKSVSLILPFSKVFSKLTTPVGTEEDHDEFNSGLTKYGLKNYPLHIIQDKITPEKLAVEMSKVTRLDLRCATPKDDMFYDSSITLCTSEFGTFMNRNHNYLQMFMTDMWDSKDFYSHQIKTGSSQFIKGPCLNWIACATPQQFVDNLPEDAASQGLLSRILPVYHEGDRIAQSLYQKRIDDSIIEDLTYDLSLIAKMHGKFIFDAEVYEEVEKDFQEYIKPEPIDPNMIEYNQRRVSHFIKVAMSISASRRGTRVITASDWQLTKKIMFDVEKYMPQALEGFGMSKTGKIAHDMKGWLETTVFNNNRSHVHLRLFKRQLLNKTMAPGEISQYIQAMEDSGYIRVDSGLVFLCRKDAT